MIIMDDAYVLDWSKNRTDGKYTARLGYNAMQTDEQQEKKWVVV